MKVLSDFIEEVLEECIWSILVTIGFGFTSDLTNKTIDLIFWEEFWNPTRRQEIIDVNKELIILNLSIGQDEEELISGDTSFGEHRLDISLEIIHVVLCGDNNSDDIIS